MDGKNFSVYYKKWTRYLKIKKKYGLWLRFLNEARNFRIKGYEEAHTSIVEQMNIFFISNNFETDFLYFINTYSYCLYISSNFDRAIAIKKWEELYYSFKAYEKKTKMQNILSKKLSKKGNFRLNMKEIKDVKGKFYDAFYKNKTKNYR